MKISFLLCFGVKKINGLLTPILRAKQFLLNRPCIGGTGVHFATSFYTGEQAKTWKSMSVCVFLYFWMVQSRSSNIMTGDKILILDRVNVINRTNFLRNFVFIIDCLVTPYFIVTRKLTNM